MKHKVAWLLVLLLAFIFLNNTSLFARHRAGKPWLLAHRGLAQTFPMEGITGETNTARRIYTPEHPYLENTIPSMEAAFRVGADMVEFDVQLTRDGQLAVFHDASLEHRTNGSGAVREHTMAQLKALDVGYGYTADNGKTYPFRGKGVGLMPSLGDVLERFPDRSLLIHIKSNDPEEGNRLAWSLLHLPDSQKARLAAYGGDESIAVLKEKLPALRVMSKAAVKKALVAYVAVGWTGYVPASMRDAFFYLPLKYARALWGWPHRFIARMDRVNTRFALVAGNGEWSEGFDTAEDLKQIPRGYWGGIWTNRVDRIGWLVRAGMVGTQTAD